MSRRQWVLLASIAIVCGFVAWLAWSSRQPPLIPDDEAHRTSATVGACLGCHGEGGPAARSAKHPLGDECFRCHGNR